MWRVRRKVGQFRRRTIVLTKLRYSVNHTFILFNPITNAPPPITALSLTQTDHFCYHCLNQKCTVETKRFPDAVELFIIPTCKNNVKHITWQGPCVLNARVWQYLQCELTTFEFIIIVHYTIFASGLNAEVCDREYFGVKEVIVQ